MHRNIKVFAFFALVMTHMTGVVFAGKIDLDYTKPSPTKTLGYSLLFPGGGYFYLSGVTPAPSFSSEYGMRGLKYLAITTLALLYTSNMTRNGNVGMASVGAVGLVVVRISDIFSSVETAEKDRHINQLLSGDK